VEVSRDGRVALPAAAGARLERLPERPLVDVVERHHPAQHAIDVLGRAPDQIEERRQRALERRALLAREQHRDQDAAAGQQRHQTDDSHFGHEPMRSRYLRYIALMPSINSPTETNTTARTLTSDFCRS